LGDLCIGISGTHEFVIEPDKIDALFEMAKDFEVEITDIGYFTNSGYLDIRYKGERAAYLDLDFMHNAVPKKYMEAEWKTPVLQEPGIVDADNNDILQQLMGSLNICSKDPVIRVYDHEVKGKTIIKPLMGEKW